ncbi:MAG TPA: restriction endonuclease [Nitrososphaera sp.]
MIATTAPARPVSEAVSAKLAEIIEKKITRFEPIIKPEGGLTYAGFSDNDLALQLDILKSLQELGIVKQEPVDYIRKCSYCGHHGLLLKISCPLCGSTNTDQGKVIEHLNCGNIDLESHFISADGGGLVCRKCKKRLKAIGVDYVKPGSYCICLSCNKLSPEGRTQPICLNCARSLAADELKVEPLFAFVVEPQGLSMYLDDSDRDLKNSIAGALEKRGVKASVDVPVMGSSQVEHKFDIIAYQTDSQDPVVAADIVKSEGPVGPEAVLNFFARCADVKVPKKILIAVSRVTEEAQKLADSYDIAVLESDGTDPEEIAGMIVGHVVGEQSTGPVEGHLEQMLHSITGMAEDSHSQTPESEGASLEKMIRFVTRAAQDGENIQDVS